MRTTIDLPDDLHRVLISLSRDRSQTLSRTVAELMRNAMNLDGPGPGLYRSEITGLLVMRGNGTPITHEDVRALEDDEFNVGEPDPATASAR